MFRFLGQSSEARDLLLHYSIFNSGFLLFSPRQKRIRFVRGRGKGGPAFGVLATRPSPRCCNDSRPPTRWLQAVSSGSACCDSAGPLRRDRQDSRNGLMVRGGGGGDGDSSRLLRPSLPWNGTTVKLWSDSHDKLDLDCHCFVWMDRCGEKFHPSQETRRFHVELDTR